MKKEFISKFFKRLSIPFQNYNTKLYIMKNKLLPFLIITIQ